MNELSVYDSDFQPSMHHALWHQYCVQHTSQSRQEPSAQRTWSQRYCDVSYLNISRNQHAAHIIDRISTNYLTKPSWCWSNTIVVGVMAVKLIVNTVSFTFFKEKTAFNLKLWWVLYQTNKQKKKQAFEVSLFLSDGIGTHSVSATFHKS